MPAIATQIPDADLQGRALNLSTLETIKNAYSSPSACIHANWCRIPMAIVIAIALFILFTCFCCWAQCMSCCCCAGPSKKKRRSAFGGDYNQSSSGLLPHSASFGHTSELPPMPSYKLNDLKKPTYAVIGDDGSVTTEDPNSRLETDFPPASPEKKTFDSGQQGYDKATIPQMNSSVLGSNERYLSEKTAPTYSQYPVAAPPQQQPYRTSPPRHNTNEDYPLSTRMNTGYQPQSRQTRPRNDFYPANAPAQRLNNGFPHLGMPAPASSQQRRQSPPRILQTQYSGQRQQYTPRPPPTGHATNDYYEASNPWDQDASSRPYPSNSPPRRY